MGIIRKTMSVSTAGIVSYRDKEERAAKYAKQTRNAARAQVAQNAAALNLQREQLEAANYGNVQQTSQAMPPQYAPTPPPPASAPAAWYPDQNQPGMLRWFDGTQWTNHTAPANQPPPPQ